MTAVALAGCTQYKITVLELSVVTSPGEGDCPGAPPPPLLRISRGSVLYGIEDSLPHEIPISELRSYLIAAKRDRPDREVLYLEIDDGVPFEQLVTAVDAAEAAGFTQRWLSVLPRGPALNRSAWARPVAH
jgi:hypothetical protein